MVAALASSGAATEQGRPATVLAEEKIPECLLGTADLAGSSATLLAGVCAMPARQFYRQLATAWLQSGYDLLI